jgi:hypothetical protein
VGAQPALGRVADLAGYGPSYAAGAGLVACSLPFVWLARREGAASDVASAPAPTLPTAPT